MTEITRQHVVEWLDGLIAYNEGGITCPEIRLHIAKLEAIRAALTEQQAFIERVENVERHLRLAAYTSAGDPSRQENMKIFAMMAGSLQAAIAAAHKEGAG